MVSKTKSISSDLSTSNSFEETLVCGTSIVKRPRRTNAEKGYWTVVNLKKNLRVGRKLPWNNFDQIKRFVERGDNFSG